MVFFKIIYRVLEFEQGWKVISTLPLLKTKSLSKIPSAYVLWCQKKAICDGFGWFFTFYWKYQYVCFNFKPAHINLYSPDSSSAGTSFSLRGSPPSVRQVSHTQLLCAFEWGSSRASTVLTEHTRLCLRFVASLVQYAVLNSNHHVSECAIP